MKIANPILYISFICLLIGCIPVKKDSQEQSVDTSEILYDLRDTILQNILQAQNDQDLTKLINYFGFPNPTYRYAAALALGSVKDPASADTLASLLLDPNVWVGSAAAFSLGQIKNPKSQDALLGGFRQYDTAGINSPINSAILEAIGKLGSLDFLQAMATVQTYEPTDTLLLLGQTRGIYRYMLRDITDPEGTATMLRYLSDKIYPQEVRLIAAHYFARSKNQDFTPLQDTLLAVFQKEQNSDIRLPLVLALGKTKTEGALAVINNIIKSDTDYRMICNALKAMNNFDYEKVKPNIIQAIRNPNIHIASSAINYLNDFGRTADAGEYRNIARENLPWQIKIPLLAVANKNYGYSYGITKGNINAELKSIFGRSTNVLEKVACIKALATDPKNHSFLLEISQQSNLQPIKSAVLEAGIDIIQSKFFSSAFSNGASIRKEIINNLLEAVKTGDDAALEIIESGVKDKNLDLKSDIDLTVLNNIKNGLAQNVYASHMLTRTLNTLEAKNDPVPLMSNYKKFSAAELSLNQSPSIAEIITDKGTIKLRFWKESAPATVLNFIKLVQSEYFNGKNFHRVVPNFVIQGGCPRGDGYGSMDYSIRSETPAVYYNKEGLVGMASSGKHTESCQFFITHSATPHLDGNYSIFAEVISGMDIVHLIQIGDKIQRINLSE